MAEEADNLCSDHDAFYAAVAEADDVCGDPNDHDAVVVCGDLAVRKVLALLNRPLRLKNRFLQLVPRLSARS